MVIEANPRAFCINEKSIRLSIFSFKYNFSLIIFIIKCLNEILVPNNRSKHITLTAHVSAINNSPFETHTYTCTLTNNGKKPKK